ncbi:lytic transglycosylase domain-containing protein [Cnuella takakiae]|nr:lytic transglycosylase domain-containing protein [Cnuella takakiae]
MVEYYLKAANMPGDLKYIPIVESGFLQARSSAGAQGFWQLMAPTAREWGLVVNNNMDERNHPQKATIAAIKELARLYTQIRKDHRVSSWVLAAAAYNYGIGNLYRKIDAQGKNYFSMELNPETALYVYKIVAVKELFEYPEVYLKFFRYNVFRIKGNADQIERETNLAGEASFQKANIKVHTNDGAHPEKPGLGNVKPPTEIELAGMQREKLKKASLVSAQLKGNYATFSEGDSLLVQLQEDLETSNGFWRAGSVLQGRGWIIDDRVFVDLGFGDAEVILYDLTSRQGIAIDSLKEREQLLLRVER